MKIQTLHGPLNLPAFLPDATYGSIQTLPWHLLKETKTPGVVVTTLHFYLKELLPAIKKFKSFHNLTGWQQPVLSDSGGFQIFSLINADKAKKDSNKSQVSDKGALFHYDGIKKPVLLTPEMSQDIQHQIGSDIRMVLDGFVGSKASYEEAKDMVELVTLWAQKSKDQFLKINKLSKEKFQKTDGTQRPLLFAIIQGGTYPDLRQESAKQLLEIGFDGYGFGGWPLDGNGDFDTKSVETFVDCLPKNSVAYGMGIGSPDDIMISKKIGLNLFDCVLPTRNARHAYAFVHKGSGEKVGAKYFEAVRIKKSKYNYDKAPLDKKCECKVCQNYTRAYLRYLYKNYLLLGQQLLTYHNLWFYREITEEG